MTVPYVIESANGVEKSYDVFSYLQKNRVIMLTGEINDEVASVVVAQLLFLESADSEQGISIYINSPGGSITAGMAIYDTMRFISCPITTICVGIAASMGAFLLAGGDKGKRLALPNSEVMIHQPIGGAKGQATDIAITAEHILRIKKRMNQMLADNTGKPVDQIAADTERDNFMTAEEALAYGLVDKIIEHR